MQSPTQLSCSTLSIIYTFISSVCVRTLCTYIKLWLLLPKFDPLNWCQWNNKIMVWERRKRNFLTIPERKKGREILPQRVGFCHYGEQEDFKEMFKSKCSLCIWGCESLINLVDSHSLGLLAIPEVWITWFPWWVCTQRQMTGLVWEKGYPVSSRLGRGIRRK